MRALLLCLALVVIAFVVGVKIGPALVARLRLSGSTVLRWLGGLLASLLLVACLNAQAVDTTGWRHDSTFVGWRYFTDSVAVWRQDSMPLTTPKPPVDTVPLPPPIGGTHEPAGFRPLVVLPLSAAGVSGSGPVGMQSWTGKYAIVTDATRGRVLECTYSGSVGGHPACSITANEAQLRAQGMSRIYLRLWVTPSLGFSGHTSGVNKLAFVGFGAQGNQFYLSMSGVGGGALRARLNFQGTTGMPVAQGTSGWNGASCSAAGSCSWSPPAKGPAIARGTWSLVEVLLTSGPLGSKTSSAVAWVNGQQAGSASGFDFLAKVNGSNTRAEKAPLSTYWGGTGGSVASPFTIRLSDWYVSGAP